MSRGPLGPPFPARDLPTRTSSPPAGPRERVGLRVSARTCGRGSFGECSRAASNCLRWKERKTVLLGLPGLGPGVGAEDWARSAAAGTRPARRAGLRRGAARQGPGGPARGVRQVRAGCARRPQALEEGERFAGTRPSSTAPPTHTPLFLLLCGRLGSHPRRDHAGEAQVVLGALRPLPDAARC